MLKSEAVTRVRVATPSDTDAICKVLNRNGIEVPDPRKWAAKWETYPFAGEFRDIPTGWVLETEDGRIIGNLDNVHTLYEMGGRRLKGVVAAGWAVDKEYRGKSMQLMMTFFRQKGVDLWLNVSANPTTAELLTAMRVPRIPIPDYQIPCFWAVHPRAFAKAALRRKSIPGAAFLAWPAGLMLWARDAYRAIGRGRMTSQVRQLEEFDSRFDGLGESLRAGATRLRAVRTQAVLEWRYGAELRDGRAVIVASEQNAALKGYAVLIRREDSEMGMILADVADLQAAGDDPATFHDLLVGAIESAHKNGIDAVKFMSGLAAKRGPANALRPSYTYRLPYWQQYFKSSPELGKDLAGADAWDFSLFDVF